MPFGRKKERLEADLEVLRLRIAKEVQDTDAGIVCFTGLGPGAGVTTIASWMAQAFAREGRPVLLVEANSATPRLHEGLRVPRYPGAAEVLEGRAEAAQAIHRVDGTGLSVLLCGAWKGSGGPYSTERWTALFNQVRADGGLVIVDAGVCDAPVGLAVAAASDLAVLVVQAGRTRWEAAAAAVDRLKHQGAVVLGVVLNKRRYPVPELVYRGL